MSDTSSQFSSEDFGQPWWLEHLEQQQQQQQQHHHHHHVHHRPNHLSIPDSHHTHNHHNHHTHHKHNQNHKHIIIFISVLVASIACLSTITSPTTTIITSVIILAILLCISNPFSSNPNDDHHHQQQQQQQQCNHCASSTISSPSQENSLLLNFSHDSFTTPTKPPHSYTSTPSSILGNFLHSPIALLSPSDKSIHKFRMASPWKISYSGGSPPSSSDSLLSGQRTPVGYLWNMFGIDIDGWIVCNIVDKIKKSGLLEVGDELISVGNMCVKSVNLWSVLSSDLDRIRICFRAASNGSVKKLVLVRTSEYCWETMEHSIMCSIEEDLSPPLPWSDDDLMPENSQCGFCCLENGKVIEMKDIARMEKWMKPCNFCTACKEF